MYVPEAHRAPAAVGAASVMLTSGVRGGVEQSSNLPRQRLGGLQLRQPVCELGSVSMASGVGRAARCCPVAGSLSQLPCGSCQVCL
jgi:hypothetical protein